MNLVIIGVVCLALIGVACLYFGKDGAIISTIIALVTRSAVVKQKPCLYAV